MAADFSILGDTKLDATGMKKGLGLVEKAAAAVGIALSTKVVANLVKMGVTYNAQMEQYQTSFEVMLGDAQRAADLIQKLKDMAAKTPFSVEDLTSSAQLLINYGLSAEEATESLQVLGDISQGSAEKLNRIALAYGQMSAKGKVLFEETRQMTEAGFNPLQAVAAMTGETLAEVSKRCEDGALSVDEVKEAMKAAASEGGRYFQSMEKQSQTLSGRWSTLKDNGRELLGAAVTPLSNMLRDKLIPAVTTLVGKIDASKLQSKIQGLLDTTVKLVPAVKMAVAAIASYKIATSIAPMILRLRDALKATFLTMSAHPIGLVIAAVAALAVGIAALVDEQQNAHTQAEKELELSQQRKQALDELAESNRDLAASCDEQAASGLAQMDHVQTLYGELTKLADENGRVADTDRARAQFILNELNTALGTEYSMTGDLINQYSAFTGSIENLIAAKRAEILLSAHEEEYRNAIEQKTQAENNFVVAKNAVADTQARINQLTEENAEDLARINELQQLYNDGAASQFDLIELENLKGAWYDELIDRQDTLVGQMDELNTSTSLWNENINTRINYETAYAAAIDSNTQLVEECLNRENIAQSESAAAVAASYAEKQQAAGQAYANSLLVLAGYLESVKNGQAEFDASYLQTLVDSSENCRTQAEELGVGIVDGQITGMNGKKIDLTTTMQSISDDTIKVAKEKAPDFVHVGVDFVGGVAQGVRNQSWDAIGAVTTMVREMISAARATAKEASPSKVMTEFGEYFAEGAVVGVRNKTAEAKKASEDMVAAMIPDDLTAEFGPIPEEMFSKGYAAGENFAQGFRDALSQMGRVVNVMLAGMAPRLAFAGANSVVNNNSQQNYFGSNIQTPDEVARALRIQQKFGLAGGKG